MFAPTLATNAIIEPLVEKKKNKKQYYGTIRHAANKYTNTNKYVTYMLLRNKCI